MGPVVADITMSLDGYVTGPGADIEHGLGIGGEPLHAWAFEDDADDREVLDSTVAATRAVVMGRRTFDVVDSPNGWNDEIGYGGKRDQSSPPPVFVVTHEPPAEVRLAHLFTFVTEGVEAAIALADETDGEGDVVLMGGANVIDQAVRAGVVDELRIHLAPILLGGGTRLFGTTGHSPLPVEPVRTVATDHATHLTYRLR